jgi:catalase
MHEMTDSELAGQIVDAVYATFGAHPGRRALHAKGVVCAATFTPTAEAAAFCRAPHLAGPEVRAHVRFSNSSGDPSVSDADPGGRGMGVKFYVDATTTDVLGSSSPAFIARTAEDFLAFSKARLAGGDALTAYLGAHPEAGPAVAAALTPLVPASYATLPFHSLHAYGFDAPDRTRQYGRYHFVPTAGEVLLEPADAATRPPDFLREELIDRFAGGPASFDVQVEVAASGDPIDDSTVLWPDGRAVVELGRLDVTALASDREHDGDVLVFDPTRVIDGISLTDDPVLHARAAIYGESVARRTAG